MDMTAGLMSLFR